MTSYLDFVREDVPGRKTPIVHVLSKSHGYSLGRILWFGAWRQFCFYPMMDTVFNVGCMNDIQAKINELMTERREKKK